MTASSSRKRATARGEAAARTIAPRAVASRRIASLAIAPRAVVPLAIVSLLFAPWVASPPARAEGPEPARRAFFRTREAEERFDRTLRPRVEAALAESDTIALPDCPQLPGDVKDGVFGYLIGLVDQGRQGLVTGAHLQAVLKATRRASRVPAELITEVARVPADVPGESWVAIRFGRPLDVAVPYSILGYHPGSLVSSETVLAGEWHVERLQIPDPGGVGRPPLVVENVALWALLEGRIEIDIDGWVDALLGSRLDDTQLVGLAVFHFRGKRCGMALGYSVNGEPRSGVLDLAGDEILFPTPDELKAIARHLRSRIVQRLSRFDLPVVMPE